jgi:hypothetical protein
VAVEDDHPPAATLEAREPTVEDLVELCRHLNATNAKYLVIGGFAIRAAGYDRRTMDIDLLIDTALENEAKVFEALAYLPDQAAKELEPGEVAKYVVVRVADEIVVDLMRSASGIDYHEAARDSVTHEVDGVPIPFASPRLLWRMKRSTGRDKDLPDLQFLRYLFAQSNENPDA